MDFKHLYKNKYFLNRNLNDLKRIKSFEQEKCFLKKFVATGKICDVGCSTGEFLKHINWKGDRYGMEINSQAIEKAKKNNINFNKNILNQKMFFDLVIFRGTIQHISYPFYYIEKAYDSLKDGGFIAFLATPNASSINYRIFQSLPMLDKCRNFYIPSETTLVNALQIYGFRVLSINKPYLKSPYQKLISDHLKFLSNILFRTKFNHAFWGNSMNLIAQK